MEDKTPAIDFLIYSYFEITSDCKKDEMIDACIKRAYLDTCRRINFPTRAFFSKDDQKGLFFFTTVSKVIREKIVEDLKKWDYALWHEKSCKAIIDEAKSEPIREFYGEPISLTYGHAQKWVNMTMKYLYLLEMLLHKSYVNCNWDKLHVPIDSYIIEAFDAQSGRKTEDTLGTSIWSKIADDEKYTQYQKALQTIAGEKTPIAWEGSAWIGIAKERTKKDNEQKRKRLEFLKRKF